MKAPSLALRIIVFLILGIQISKEIDVSFNYLFISLLVLFLSYFIFMKMKRVSIFKSVILTLISSLLILHVGALRELYDVEHEQSLKITDCNQKYCKAEIIEGKFKPGKYNQLCLKLMNEYTDSSRLNRSESVLAIVKLKAESALTKGSVVVFSTDFDSIRNSVIPGSFDTENYWNSKGVYLKCFLKEQDLVIVAENRSVMHFFDRTRSVLTKQLNSVLDAREASIANALLLGDKAELTSSTKSAFKAAGAMHVLAVSGLHVGILLFCLQFLFKRIRVLRKKNLYFLTALLVLWFYAFLTGASPSVLRATIMFSFLVIGKMRGHGFFSMDILLSAAICMLLYNPNYLFDIGFQLSFSAMIAISLFFNKIKRLFFPKNKMLEILWDGTALCFAAQLGTVPISLFYFHQFPNYFLLTNILLVLYSFLCMFSGLLFLATFYIPYLSDVTAFILKWVYFTFCEAIDFIANLPNALAIGFNLSLVQVLGFYFTILLLYFASELRKFKLINIAAGLLLIQLCFMFWKREVILKSDLLFVCKTEMGTRVMFKTDETNFWMSSEEKVSKNILYSSASFATQFGGQNKFLCFSNRSLEVRDLKIISNQESTEILYKGVVIKDSELKEGEIIKIP